MHSCRSVCGAGQEMTKERRVMYTRIVEARQRKAEGKWERKVEGNGTYDRRRQA